jgi:uncharacterized membrane protein
VHLGLHHDKIGIGYVPPLLYTYLALWMSVVLLTPWTLRLVGRGGLQAEIRSSRWGTVLAGFTTLAAYGLVLLAMSLGMPAAYAGALREISVVFGAAYGVLVLKEQGGPMRPRRASCAGSADDLGMTTQISFGEERQSSPHPSPRTMILRHRGPRAERGRKLRRRGQQSPLLLAPPLLDGLGCVDAAAGRARSGVDPASAKVEVPTS